jgi:PAS domain S-box-containing protein
MFASRRIPENSAAFLNSRKAGGSSGNAGSEVSTECTVTSSDKVNHDGDTAETTSPEFTVLSSLNALSFLPLVARLTSFPVMISDLSGATVWANNAFTRMSGWQLDEIIGRAPHEFLHGKDTDKKTVDDIRSQIIAGQSFQHDLLNYRKDGSTFWVSLDAQPILDEQGALRGYLSVQNDISDRKKIEVQLWKEHRLLEAISSCLTTFISSEDARATFGELLKKLLALTDSGYGMIAEVLFDEQNLPWLRTLAMKNVAWDEPTRKRYEDSACKGLEFRNFQTLLGQALSTAKCVLTNSPSTDCRGGYFPDEHSALSNYLGIPLLRGNRMVGLIALANCPQGYSANDISFLEPLGTVIGQLIDAYRRDVQRREIERSLRETEEWLEETGRVAEVGAWQYDLATATLRWSAQTFRMHEVPPGYVPDFEKAIAFYDAEARPVIREAVKRATNEGVPWDLELPFTTALGRFRWVRAVGHVAVENSEVTRIFGTIKDVTERRRADEERERLQSQFARSQKMESVGRLAGGIAHDFNNMLAVILGHAEMLSLDETLLPRHKNHLKAIQTAGQRSADLTQQLLAFARRQNAAPQKIDINKSIKRMLDLLRRSMGERIELEWMPGEDVWLVSIDPVQLDQILANLCMNARDAITDAGRILLSTCNEAISSPQSFRSSEIQPGSYVVLTVSDTGCGMSETTLQHLFEPFNTTKPPGQGPGPGLGLGLATVYGIVQQNSGAIDVESDATIGTTIRIYLPRVNVAEIDTTPRPDTETFPKKKTILLVEDEPSLLKIGKISLKQLGYKVLSATNSREALQMVQSHGPSIHVIVTDIVLPGCNGWNLARQIHGMHPEVRFVFMSGYGESVQPGAGTLKHPFTVLSKPFDLQHLESAVKDAVGLEENV